MSIGLRSSTVYHFHRCGCKGTFKVSLCGQISDSAWLAENDILILTHLLAGQNREVLGRLDSRAAWQVLWQADFWDSCFSLAPYLRRWEATKLGAKQAVSIWQVGLPLQILQKTRSIGHKMLLWLLHLEKTWWGRICKNSYLIAPVAQVNQAIHIFGVPLKHWHTQRRGSLQKQSPTFGGAK